jgi:uncharacterized delta-60 repeat protein
MKTKVLLPRKILIFVFVCLLQMTIVKPTFSQSQKMVFPDWLSTSGSQNFFHKSVTKTDPYGNVYIVGATINGSGNNDILLVKYNRSGVLQWTQQYNGNANLEDMGVGLYIDGSGNVYVVGTTSTSTTNSDIITIKYNSSGTQQWLSTFNASGNTFDSGADIIVDGSGNVYVTGGGYNSSLNTDILTIKYNSSGTQQWAKYFDYLNLNGTGVKIQLQDTLVVVSGICQYNTNSYYYGVLQYGQVSGNQINVSISGSSSTNIDQINDMVIDASGYIYIAGASPVTGQGYDFTLIKLNPNLGIAWERTYNGNNNLDDIARGVRVDASGNVYVTGYSTTTSQGKNIITHKYNSSGTLQWTETYNNDLDGDDEAYAMAMDNSGNIYVTGYTSTEIDQFDVFTIKYNASGNTIWSIHNDGPYHLNDKSTNIAIDNNGDIVIAALSETAPGQYQYLTVKYVEKDIIIPTDYNGEDPNSSFLYYKNNGQIIDTDGDPVSSIKYYNKNSYPELYFQSISHSMVFSSVDTSSSTEDTLHRIDVSFPKGNASTKSYPIGQKKEYNNYYLGHCPEGITHVYGNQQLVIPDLYNNIDLLYSSNQNGLKFYLIIKPGGDPTSIEMLFTGADSLKIDASTNDFTIFSSVGNLVYERPTVYQIDANNDVVDIQGWTADWQFKTSTCLNFNIGSYNTSLPLIIQVDLGHMQQQQTNYDNLLWSTYYGGSQVELAYAMNVDNQGQQNICGININSGFPLYNGASYPLNAAEQYCFLIAFKPQHERVFTTIFGGSGNSNFAYDVASNSSREILVVGKTNCGDFPVKYKTGAYNDAVYSSTTSKYDGFIAKFHPILGTITWATYLGGDNNYNDQVSSLYFDSSDKMFLTGWTQDATFPVCTLANATNNSFAGSYDIFVARLNTSDNFDWCTFYGSSDIDKGLSITGDNSGNTYVYGYTSSANFPVVYTSQYHQSYVDAGDACLVRFNSSCLCDWSTCIGGSGYDCDTYGILKCIKHSGNNLFITGKTSSNDFPNVQNSYRGGACDGYLCAFNSSGAMIHSEYIGGTGWDEINALAVDEEQRIFLTGTTNSSSGFPYQNITNVYDQPDLGGDQAWNPYGDDAFILCYNSSFNLLWGTFFGGKSTNYDIAYDLDIHGMDLYLTGTTSSKNIIQNPQVDALFPIVELQGAYNDDTYNGAGNSDNDLFISLFDLTPLVGIKDNELNQFVSVYPNPCTDNIILELSEQQFPDIKIEIFDYTGKGCFVMNSKNESIANINTKMLVKGVYMLKVTSGNSVYYSKFIKL